MAKENDRHLLRDISLELLHRELRPVYRVKTTQTVPARGRGRVLDFALIDGRDNLGQALVMRILTPLGELARLGHPAYGSRVHAVVGSGNTDTVRNLLRLYILEAVLREPRVDEVIQLTVTPAAGTRQTVDVSLIVSPVGASDSVQVGPFSIDLG